MNGNCCNGLNASAYLLRANRPGLTALNYQVGTHATFLEAMLARLSSQDLPALAALRTRDPHDPAIALLDAWAIVADVLSFYQERIANEGYLRTATERRSLVELARLVDYRLRPGIAASAYLAFTMEPGFNKNAKVPHSTRVQSVPAPGELPQTFETEQDIEARTDWNHLQPRLTRPQFITFSNVDQHTRLFFADTSTQLQPNDPLLLVFGDGEGEQVLRRVKSVDPNLERKQTEVKLFLASELALGSATSGAIGVVGAIAGSTATNTPISSTSVFNPVGLASQLPKDSQSTALSSLSGAIKTLAKPPSLPPINSQQLKRSKAQAFDPAIDIASQLLVNLKQEIETSFYTAWSNIKVPVEPVLEPVKSIEKFNVKASPFGHNAPLKPVYEDNQGHPIRYEEWPLSDPMTVGISLFTTNSVPQPGIALNAVRLAATSGESFLQAAVTVSTGSTSQTVELHVAEAPVEIQVNQQRVRVSISTSSPSDFSISSTSSRSARIRFVHALPEEGPVDVYTVDAENSLTILFENVQPFQATEYIVLNSNELSQLRLAVRPAGQTNATFLINERVNSWGTELAYSIYALERESSGDIPGRFKFFSTQADSLTLPLENRVRVKIINASHYRSGIEVGIDDRTLIQATSEPSSTSFINQTEFAASDTHVLTVTDTETGQLLLSSNDLQLRADKVYNIVLIGGDRDDNPLRFFVVEADTTLPEEQARITFDFLDLERSYRIVFTDNSDDDSGLFIQITNGQAITVEFVPDTSHQLTLDNQKITIEGNLLNQQAPLQIQEETYESVAPAFRHVVALDAQYDQILPGSWVVINHPQRQVISQVKDVKAVSKAEYGITGRVTQLTLDQAWLETSDRTLAALRETTIYAQSEPLALAEEVLDPIQYAIGGEDPETSASFEIELASLYDGLKPGQWLIVSGERADIPNAVGVTENITREMTAGVRASELVMLAGVRQGVAQVPLVSVDDSEPDSSSENNSNAVLIDLPGDRTHSFLQLVQPLAYKYKRDTVTIYGNVAKATHGETRREVLGSGDASKTLQRFRLSKSPLTHLSAPTRSGTESTLAVRVNDVEWREVDNLAQAGANQHSFVTYTDDDDKNHITFGDGTQGARLPSGVENVTAVYRDGIGKDGNVKAEQLKLLATRPLGVKGVINPLAATGGASRETMLQAKRNIPLAVMALDRLVSVQDYADFVRTYAGIAKADVQQLADGRRQLMHLTIAGTDDIPISEHSDLYRNLGRSLQRFGDPHQPVQVDVRELMLLIMSARIQILPDYLWESVKVAVEAALFEEFSFERRHLGQDVLLSEVISTIHRVPGVAYVDVDVLDSVSESEAEDPSLLTQKLLQLAQGDTMPALPQPAEQIDVVPDVSSGATLGVRPDVAVRRDAEPEIEPEASSVTGMPQPRPRIPVRLAHIISDAVRTIQPAQLAILSPKLPETLKLEEITP